MNKAEFLIPFPKLRVLLNDPYIQLAKSKLFCRLKRVMKQLAACPAVSELRNYAQIVKLTFTVFMQGKRVKSDYFGLFDINKHGSVFGVHLPLQTFRRNRKSRKSRRIFRRKSKLAGDRHKAVAYDLGAPADLRFFDRSYHACSPSSSRSANFPRIALTSCCGETHICVPSRPPLI